MMLSINSTLHEIQQAHRRDKMNMKQIARALSVGENKLRRVLTMAGFEYDASIKEWRYTRQDDGAVLQRSFWSLDEYGVGKPDKTKKPGVTIKTDKTRKTNDDNEGNVLKLVNGNEDNIANVMPNNEGNVKEVMTGNEANAISNNEGNEANVMPNNEGNVATNAAFTQDEILILKELAARHVTAAPVSDSTDILEALKAAPKGKTTQKTFVINTDIIDSLDAFCETHRIKKSDFLAIAIQDALNKFNS